MPRAGQSAMEFLLTYGWAILVVMVVGITMWQLGVFNIGGTVPPRVTGTNYQKPLDATLQFCAWSGATSCPANCVPLAANTCLQVDFVNGEPGTVTFDTSFTAEINDISLATGNCEIDGTEPGTTPVTISQGDKYTVRCPGGIVAGPSFKAGEMATGEFTMTYDLSIVGVSRTRSETAVLTGQFE